MTDERRTAATELRVEGRRLTGIAMRYGDISPSHRERFAPGSISFADPVVLDREHNRDVALAWMPDGGLELRDEDDALHLVATLPPIPAADGVLDEVRAGKITGLSVDFRALDVTREGGIRVIRKALVRGVGLVRRPSYEASRVEARSARLRVWL